MVGMYVVRVWGPLNGTAEQEEAYKKVRRDVACNVCGKEAAGCKPNKTIARGRVEWNGTTPWVWGCGRSIQRLEKAKELPSMLLL